MIGLGISCMSRLVFNQSTNNMAQNKRVHSWFNREMPRLDELPDEEAEKPFITSTTDSESDDEVFHPKQKPWYRHIIPIAGIAIALFLGMIAFSILINDSKSGSVPNAPQPQVQGGSVVTAHCGTTPEEAKERGCYWDIMSFGWMHPSCLDQAESAKWAEKYGPWKWYTERPDNTTSEEDLTPLTQEELPYTPVVWTTQGYHVQHCLYVLKMIHLAAMKEGPVSNEGIELGHTDHCAMLIGNPELVDYEEVNTRVHLLFVQCVTLT